MDELYADIHTERREPFDAELPFVMINMVFSLDGETSEAGISSKIGSDLDRRVMNTLRASVDAIMVGAGTLRAEKYSVLTPQHLSKARRARNQPAQPWLVIPTKTGDMPENNLLGSSPETTILLVPEDGAIERHDLACHIVKTPGTSEEDRFGMIQPLKLLKKRFGIQNLLVEGGPTLNHQLFEDNLVNELFLTLAPNLLGTRPNPTSGIMNGPRLNTPKNAKLRAVHAIQDELFLRYEILCEKLQPSTSFR